MSTVNKIAKTAISGVLALVTSSALITANTAMAADQPMEKCYGIAKAGKNDCQTSVHSCSGSATKDNQKDAFILLPKGLCEKIAGGSTTPGKEEEKK